jgi:hypothetical protein
MEAALGVNLKGRSCIYRSQDDSFRLTVDQVNLNLIHSLTARYTFPSAAFCEMFVGGVFNPDNSTTYARIQALDVPDYLENPFRGANGSLSTDIWTMQMADQNLTLSNFQFGLIDETIQLSNLIGLVCPFPFPSPPQTPPR